MTTKFYFSILFAGLIFLSTGCTYPNYTGKFIANDNCTLIDYVQVFPDKTADIRFKGIKEAPNWDLKVKISRDTVLRIHNEYEFIYRNDSLIEKSRVDIDCICIRESLYKKQQEEKPAIKDRQEIIIDTASEKTRGI